MKTFLQFVLILLLTFIVTPIYGEEKDYKGLWACETAKDFGYQNGRIVNFKNTKLSVTVTEKTVTISGGTIGEITIMVMQDELAKPELIAHGFMTFFKLHNGAICYGKSAPS